MRDNILALTVPIFLRYFPDYKYFCTEIYKLLPLFSQVKYKLQRIKEGKPWIWFNWASMSLGQNFDSVHDFLIFLAKGSYWTATEACWCLSIFERRVRTCITHKLPGFAIGWEFLLLQSSVFWASVQWCWGAFMWAGMRGRGMRKWSTRCQLMVYGEVLESKQDGGGEDLNLSERRYWAYYMCCSWSSPGSGKQLFLLVTLLWSDMAFLCLIFSEVFLWNWIWKTQLVWFILFCEPWNWQYGLFVCVWL